MFDTMTLTKVVGALCGSLLVFLLGGFFAEEIYHSSAEGEQSYVIDTGVEEAAPAEDAVPFADLLAAADPAAGESVFNKCRACHKMDGTDGTGPHLNGVVDRPVASIAGFAYSDALAGLSAEAWTGDNLNGFLENPKGYAPGTKMSFAGLPSPEERANLIAWLGTSTP